MDIYEATQTLLQNAVGASVNVDAFVLKYNEAKSQFDLPQFPAVTWNYATLTPIVGAPNLYRINLDVEVWGDLEQIDANAKTVERALNAQRVTVGNVEFSAVMMDSRDVAELGLDFKRRYMRFAGLVDVQEES